MFSESMTVHNGICLDGPWKGIEHGWPYDEFTIMDTKTTYKWDKDKRGWLLALNSM